MKAYWPEHAHCRSEECSTRSAAFLLLTVSHLTSQSAWPWSVTPVLRTHTTLLRASRIWFASVLCSTELWPEDYKVVDDDYSIKCSLKSFSISCYKRGGEGSSPFTFDAVELSAHLSSFLPSLNSPTSSLCTSSYTYKNFTRFSERYFLSFANNFNTSFSFWCWPCLVNRITHSLKKWSQKGTHK